MDHDKIYFVVSLSNDFQCPGSRIKIVSLLEFEDSQKIGTIFVKKIGQSSARRSGAPPELS